MKISTTAQYEELTAALQVAGYNIENVYEALEGAGFSVDIAGTVYEKIYASRVLAIMRSNPVGNVAPLKLKLKRKAKA